MTTGYLTEAYAHALVDLGEPVYLRQSQGWILTRPIPGSSERDAIGLYPLFACRHWDRLAEDLAQLDLVSLVMVPDPLGNYLQEDLQRAFPDLLRPFKEHYIIDLARPLEKTVAEHHRRNARKALASVRVERCDPNPAEWIGLYDHLRARHAIRGPAAFSAESLARQLRVPGMLALRAVYQSETVGMTLWYRNRTCAWHHLAAYTPQGYSLNASFALFWRACEIFAAEGIRDVNLGGGAGLENNGLDGLSRFKRGWATTTRTAYLGGRILNPRVYSILVANNTAPSNYFPGYRIPQ